MATQELTTAGSHEVHEDAAGLSPFLDVTTFAKRGNGAAAAVPEPAEFISPFLTEAAPGDAASAIEAEFIRELAELEDAEFDEAIAELVAEAHDVERLHLEAEHRGNGDLEAVLEAHFAPLRSEAEDLLGRMADAANEAGAADLDEPEIEEMLAAFEPEATGLSPAFEGFLKKLFKKAKKVAKGVARRVKKVARKAARLASRFSPVALALRKLKGLVRPLIQRVLKMALNKLPARLRPLAKKLAKRFLREAEFAELQGEGGDTAVHAVHRIQQELDVHVAEIVLADDESEQDKAVTAYAAESRDDEAGDIEKLYAAREQFIDRFNALAEDQDPTPVVEEFLPAVMGALRLGVRLVGRQRVVNFLAGLATRIVARFMPQAQAQALSRAMVDAGLKLVNLEATDVDVQRAAGGVIADTIEEAVRRVAALDDYILEDEALLEDAAQEAFNAAAAAHFPPTIVLPELRETGDDDLAFQLAPSGNYLKYPRDFPVTITPDKARVRTFGGERLSEFLQRAHGVAPDTTVRGHAHLYQARPGTWLSKISRDEGLPGGARRGWQLLHPLTPMAAAALLGRPRLGVRVQSRFLQTRHRIAVGQRFYYLRLETPGSTTVGRPGELNVVLDLHRSQLRVYIFLSELEAMRIAERMKLEDDIGTAIRLMNAAVRSGLNSLRHHLKIIPSDGIVFEEGGLAAAAGSAIVSYLTKALMQWLHRHLRLYVAEARAHFIAKVADARDGVTVVVTINNPAGLGVIREALRGNVLPLLKRSLTIGRVPDADVDVRAGFIADD